MKITLIFLATLAATIASSNIMKPTFLTDEFINSINEKQSTWKAGRNFPEDMSLEELKRLSGSIEAPIDPTKSRPHTFADEDIPEHFDARERWPECRSIREIRNQGSCGSCWVFSTVTAIADRTCIATKGQYVQLSPDDVMSCCSYCGSCSGGLSLFAWEFWVKYGIVSGGESGSNQGCKPYAEEAFQNAETPKCVEACTNKGYHLPFEQDKYFGTNYYYYHRDEKGIQGEIMRNGPVTATFEVYQDFYNYKSGVYQHVDGEFAGRHDVRIIGWGVEKRTPYWLIANSWGTSWGDLGGYFKFLRGQNHTGIENQVFAGNPKL